MSYSSPFCGYHSVYPQSKVARDCTIGLSVSAKLTVTRRVGGASRQCCTPLGAAQESDSKARRTGLQQDLGRERQGKEVLFLLE